MFLTQTISSSSRRLLSGPPSGSSVRRFAASLHPAGTPTPSSRPTLRRLAGLITILFCSNPTASGQFTVTGVIRAQEEIVIRSEFPGIVERIAVREGDRVSERQLLVELRNERQKINLDLSRAGLAKAEASVKEIQALLISAERELARVQVAGNALPRKEVEDKGDQVSRLRANLQVQLASVAQAKEDVRLREQEINETRLTAPFAGTI